MKKTSLLLLIVFSITSVYAVDNELILEEKFPKQLSDFHFFKDTHAQIPSKGVLPYELISSLFSDYSYKQRWVYVPKNKKAVLLKRPENEITDDIFDIIVEGLQIDKKVKIHNFGTFKLSNKTGNSFPGIPTKFFPIIADIPIPNMVSAKPVAT